MWHQLERSHAFFTQSENKMRTYHGLKLQRGKLLTTIFTDQETNRLKPQQALFTLCRKKKKKSAAVQIPLELFHSVTGL